MYLFYLVALIHDFHLSVFLDLNVLITSECYISGDSHPGDISYLCVDAQLVFTACGNVIRAFQGGRQVVHTFEGHEHPVHLLLPYGRHLISIDDASCLKIWDIASHGITCISILL